MSTVQEPNHPLYVAEENRKIARERAQKYTDMIADYLEAKKHIPTGFEKYDQIQENKKRVLKVLNGAVQDWNHYQWHIKNAIRDVATLAKIISVSDQEASDIEKTATQYRWSVSPYYASLMDPEDRECPTRKQSVPTIQEYFFKEEPEDHYAVVYNSPAPLITRLYADRLIINVSNVCAMFCRHCLRKKDIASSNMIYSKEDVQAAIDYIAESPEVRDVLITGGNIFPQVRISSVENLPIKVVPHKAQESFEIIVDYILFLKATNSSNIDNQLIPIYFEQIIDGMVYELYFPELLKKHKREIIKHLGELPQFTDDMSDEQKMKICKKVFDRLNDKEHPVRVNLKKMKEEIPEIAIIEGGSNGK